ncbi:feruloyl esterase a [Stemphylium lycopersici]|uniref:Feruloyl esterase a n=1 Tax=Stemphylium lycopersici TaxID=183478 RepID=A0A364N0V8_STELY|nr:feruloyl esterase a [Stemphylium lycopersici]RAR08975.1 feruloyl esterase a [Stemphylium lycopersici]
MKFSTLALAALAAPMIHAAPANMNVGRDIATPTETDKNNGKYTGASKLKHRQQAFRRRELIQPSLYPILQRYTRFAVASLATFVYGLGECANPPFQSVLVRKVTNLVTDTQVAIFRDDAAREFVVSFPGTSSIQDFGTDFNFFFMPFDNVPGCDGCQVHGGVLKGWKSVKEGLVAALGELRAEKPGYRTVVVGHSLGGGLASVAFTDLKANGVRVDAAYTMGSLRVGNQAYADFTDRLSGASRWGFSIPGQRFMK